MSHSTFLGMHSCHKDRRDSLEQWSIRQIKTCIKCFKNQNQSSLSCIPCLMSFILQGEKQLISFPLIRKIAVREKIKEGLHLNSNQTAPASLSY